MGKTLDYLIVNVRGLLEQRKWSQKKLAEIMKIPAPTITKYLKRERVPGLDAVDAIADAFGISASELLRPPGSDGDPVQVAKAMELLGDAYGILQNKKASAPPPGKPPKSRK